MNKNGLDSLPRLPWTIALGKKESSLLISFLCRWLTVPPPLSLPLSLPPFCFLSCSLTLYHFALRTVFCAPKGEAVCPLRIKSGLQSCDECSHECSHLTSLAHFSRSLTTSNMATVARRVIEILHYILHACLEETLICVMLHYLTAFILLFIFPPFFLFGNSFNSRLSLAAQRGIISCIPAFI